MRNNSKAEHIPRVLSIAGSDSGGGAGIQADLKTFHNIGVYGMTAITALTAQNTLGVQGIHEVPPEFLEAQILSVLSDIGADAVKTGMLLSTPLIQTTARLLTRFRIQNLVVDPVMVSKGGAPLLVEDAVQTLKDVLIPLSTVVTPNLDEAEALVGSPVRSVREMRDAARSIHDMGAGHVLIKGGHLEGRKEPQSGELSKALDILYDGKTFHELTAPHIPTPHTHGTGCTLSSAIAAWLALGKPVLEAAQKAKDYITQAIRAASPLGKGIGPVNHLSWRGGDQRGSLT